MKATTKPFSGFRLIPLLSITFYVLILTTLFMACSRENSSQKASPDQRKTIPVPVGTAKAVSKPVSVELQAVGTVESSASVIIRSQVEGEITMVHFNEGEMVTAGRLLFTIDPRPYAVSLKQAEAALARNRAELDNAKKQAARYQEITGQGLVSEEQIDQITTAVAGLTAVVQADEAAVENARLKLGFCSIRSPITGLAGSLKLDKGNLVKANDNERYLVTVNQISPITVAFAIPERNLAEVRRRMGAGLLTVKAVIPGEEENPVLGRLSFIENRVDTHTASIMLRATYPNTDHRLWPGQFVHVALALGAERTVTVVPAQAVQTGQRGEYLFVVRPDQTVEFRQVTTGQNINGEMVITSGLNPGETVVIDGQLKLTDGSMVKLSDRIQEKPEKAKEPPAGDRKGK
ncbi:MAG: efflux RND transporter periplasmic adaptor subunit [Thermodesulfobacteriota bacterium]